MGSGLAAATTSGSPAPHSAPVTPSSTASQPRMSIVTAPIRACGHPAISPASPFRAPRAPAVLHVTREPAPKLTARASRGVRRYGRIAANRGESPGDAGRHTVGEAEGLLGWVGSVDRGGP